MLRMRPQQMQALALDRQAAFRREARELLQRVWPEGCEELGEEGLDELVATGTERGLDHGIVDGGELTRWLELSILLGEDFETSGDYPWVAEILDDETLDGSLKMRQLRHRTRVEIDRIAEALEKEGGADG